MPVGNWASEAFRRVTGEGAHHLQAATPHCLTGSVGGLVHPSDAAPVYSLLRQRPVRAR